MRGTNMKEEDDEAEDERQVGEKDQTNSRFH